MLVTLPVMSQWYYEETGSQRGPVSEEEITRLLVTRAIAPATLVWTTSMKDWKPASSIAGFNVSPYAPPDSDVASQVDWSGYKTTGPQIRPWIRYWARTCDFLLFCLVVGGVLSAFLPGFDQINDTLLGLLMLLAYNFVEPLFLALFGTTPFKGLLCVRVRNQDRTKPSYIRGLRRTVYVWVRGQGLGIPLIALFTCISSYKRLTSNGVTSWDEDGGFIVTHREIPWWRWLILAAIVAAFVGLMVIGQESG